MSGVRVARMIRQGQVEFACFAVDGVRGCIDFAPLALRYLYSVRYATIFLGHGVAVLRIAMQNIRVFVDLSSQFSISNLIPSPLHTRVDGAAHTATATVQLQHRFNDERLCLHRLHPFMASTPSLPAQAHLQKISARQGVP